MQIQIVWHPCRTPLSITALVVLFMYFAGNNGRVLETVQLPFCMFLLPLLCNNLQYTVNMYSLAKFNFFQSLIWNS